MFHAGSPSGHAMGAAGVWYVMVTATLACATEKQCPPLLYKFLQLGLWGLMGLVLLLVCMSRVYVAAHFPHQVIAGVFMGLLVATVVSGRKSIYTASMTTYFFITLFLTSFGVGFNALLEALGVPLHWTLELARRWCVNPEWAHLNSTPLASLLRNMGSLLGLGLGLHSPLNTEIKKTKSSPGFKVGSILVSLFLLQLLDGWTLSTEHLATFYFLSFFKSAVALLIPTTLVPWALSWVFIGKREDKNL